MWSAGLVILSGCADQSIREVDTWSSGVGVNCQSVVFIYTASFESLDAVVGVNLVPLLQSDDQSVLRLVFVSCHSENGSSEPAEAQVLIELNPDRLPVQLVGSSAWDAYVLHLANNGATSHQVMNESKLATLRADVSLHVSEDTGLAVGKLEFSNGSVTATTSRDCGGARFVRTRMLIGTGAEYSVLFGEESGFRCALDENSLSVKGLTPFAGLDLEAHGAVWIPELRWDYTVWRNVAIQGVSDENQ